MASCFIHGVSVSEEDEIGGDLRISMKIKETNNAEDVEEEEQDLTSAMLEQSEYLKSDQPLHSPISPSNPSPLKLVSAMRGSLEKQGIPPKKLDVTWAADVYDPQPTALDHFTTTRRSGPGARSRRAALVRVSRSGREILRRRYRRQRPRNRDVQEASVEQSKYGGSANRCFIWLEDHDRLLD